MNKFLNFFFPLITLLFSVSCSTNRNLLHKDLLGTWGLDSIKISGKKITLSESQRITFNRDSTYIVHFDQHDIIGVRKGKYNLITTRGLENVILTFTNQKGGLDSLTIVSLKDKTLWTTHETQSRSGTNELKVYQMNNYFSKIKN